MIIPSGEILRNKMLENEQAGQGSVSPDRTLQPDNELEYAFVRQTVDHVAEV